MCCRTCPLLLVLVLTNKSQRNIDQSKLRFLVVRTIRKRKTVWSLITACWPHSFCTRKGRCTKLHISSNGYYLLIFLVPFFKFYLWTSRIENIHMAFIIVPFGGLFYGAITKGYFDWDRRYLLGRILLFEQIIVMCTRFETDKRTFFYLFS